MSTGTIFGLIIAFSLFLICFVIWLLVALANKLWPRYSRKQYLLALLLAPIALELILVLLAFIVPNGSNRINLEAIYRQAQFTTGWPRSQVEINASARAKEIIQKKFPVGSDVEPLISFLEKSEISCKRMRVPQEPLLYGICYYTHRHPEGIARINWGIDIYKTIDSKISEITVYTQFENN